MRCRILITASMSHTAQNLENLKEELLSRKASLEAELIKSTEDLIEDEPMFPDAVDQAAADSGRDVAVRIKNRERDILVELKEAIRRIEDGVFGICEECDEPISEARMRANPSTTLCINCKAELESHQQRYARA